MHAYSSVEYSLPTYEEFAFAVPPPQYDSPPKYQVLPNDNYVMGPSNTLANFRSGTQAPQQQQKQKNIKTARRFMTLLQRMLAVL